MNDTETTTTPSDTASRMFYHGTKAELKPGDLLQGGYSSQLHGAEIAMDLLQRDAARGYLGRGASEGRRRRPNLRGRTDWLVYG